MTTSDRRLAATATGQLGVFSLAQAHDAGLTNAQLRNRVQSGFLVRIGPNAYRWSGAPNPALSELVGLLIDIGGDARACGPTAAALHGFDGHGLRPPFHIVIGRGRDVQRVGHVIHTTTVLPLIDRARVNDVPCTSAARTLIDLARTATAEELTIAFDSGLRDGRFSESLVHRRIVSLRSKGRFGVPRLLAAIEGSEIVRGGHSWLEREFLRLLASVGLPRPSTQVVLTRAGDRLVRVDCRFPGTNLVVELLGYRHHRSKQQLDRDVERLNALVLAGFRVLQFTYDQVVASPHIVIATLLASVSAQIAV
jgi:Protein of unknown function (DUF559)